MNDFTVFDVDFPTAVKQRVIVNTDAKNEADDQYAIVHAVLTPSFDLLGIIRCAGRRWRARSVSGRINAA